MANPWPKEYNLSVNMTHRERIRLPEREIKMREDNVSFKNQCIFIEMDKYNYKLVWMLLGEGKICCVRRKDKNREEKQEGKNKS